MLGRCLRAGLLLLATSLQVNAEWEFSVFTAQQLDAGGLDRAFECEVRQLMDEHAERLQGVDAVVTRFGNTIVITGQARDADDRARVDRLVLDAAGITREGADSPAVVPASTRACEGRALASNTKRKSIVKTGKDCSSLRTDDGGRIRARGRVFNHIAVASSDPVQQLARAGLLAARARLSLVDAGVINAMDGSLVRLVVQDGVIYVLGNLDPVLQSEIRATLMKIDGTGDVRFYVD